MSMVTDTKAIRRAMMQCLECASGFTVVFVKEERRQAVVACPFCGCIEGLVEERVEDSPLLEGIDGEVL